MQLLLKPSALKKSAKLLYAVFCIFADFFSKNFKTLLFTRFKFKLQISNLVFRNQHEISFQYVDFGYFS